MDSDDKGKDSRVEKKGDYLDLELDVPEMERSSLDRLRLNQFLFLILLDQ